MGHALTQMPQAVHLLEYRGSLVLDDEAEGTCFNALAAAGTEFAADHPDTLGVLGDRAGGTGLGALAALDADHGSDVFAALNDLQGSLIGVEFLYSMRWSRRGRTPDRPCTARLF